MVQVVKEGHRDMLSVSTTHAGSMIVAALYDFRRNIIYTHSIKFLIAIISGGSTGYDHTGY